MNNKKLLAGLALSIVGAILLLYGIIGLVMYNLGAPSIVLQLISNGL